MRVRLQKALKVLALCLLVGAVHAQDDPPGRVGRLAAQQGEVWVQQAEQGEWIAALPNRPFTGGERLSTGPGASAQLRIGSTTVFLGEQTEFEALRLDDERMQFRVQRGQMALRITSNEVANELEVLHPEARFGPRRAGFYRVDRLAEASDLSVWRGEMQIDAHNLSLTLYAGQRAAFWREGPLGDTTRQWLTPQQDDFALAVQREDQALAQLTPSSLIPAEMTGVEDLQRYGHWQQHPEYGAVWMPSTVTIGWAPYRYGEWVWVSPWGWTWVDAAPWGFAPFHYGRWLYWGNRWAWTPGPRVARPVYAPALVGWVGAPPPRGGAWGGRPPPAHSWVPLGPREAYVPGYRASPGHFRRINPHAPGGPLTPPHLVNRGAPGGLTALPTLQTPPRPPQFHHPPRAGDGPRRPGTPVAGGGQTAPPRAPPQREQVAPRAVLPVTPGDTAADDAPLRPASRNTPPAVVTPPPARPAPMPPAAANPPAQSSPAEGPFGGRPARPTPPEEPRRERQAPAVAPPQTVRAPPATALPQPAPAARPEMQRPEVRHAEMPRPEMPRQETARPAAPGRTPDAATPGRRGADPGERPRMPDARQPGPLGRER